MPRQSVPPVVMMCKDEEGNRYYEGCRGCKFYYRKRSVDGGVSKRKAYHAVKQQRRAVYMNMKQRHMLVQNPTEVVEEMMITL